MNKAKSIARAHLIELYREANLAYIRDDPPTRFEVYLADHLIENGVTIPVQGKWHKEPLPVPENAKNKNMEHYRLVCPFCGKRNGKRREKYCPECGAMLK